MRVINAVFEAVKDFLPERTPPKHPLNCHRPYIDDETCFKGIVYRLCTGCSWEDAGTLVGVSDATLRRRRDAWVAAGVFDNLVQHAIKAFDRIIGLDLSEVCVDGHQHKAPCDEDKNRPQPHRQKIRKGGSGLYLLTTMECLFRGRLAARTGMMCGFLSPL